MKRKVKIGEKGKVKIGERRKVKIGERWKVKIGENDKFCFQRNFSLFPGKQVLHWSIEKGLEIRTVVDSYAVEQVWICL